MPCTTSLNRRLSKQLPKQLTTFSKVTVFNASLLAISAVMMLYYVVAANDITATRYQIKTAHSILANLQDENSALITQRLSTEDSDALATYAISQNMVQASQVAHIFQSGSVALQR